MKKIFLCILMVLIGLLVLSLASRCCARTLSENEYLLALRRYLVSREDIMEGNPFKDFSALDENKKTHRLDEMVGKGNLVLLHFWSSWCAPCREELQNLQG